MKRKKQLKKEKKVQEKIHKLQREEHNNVRDNDLGEAVQNNIDIGSDDDNEFLVTFGKTP